MVSSPREVQERLLVAGLGRYASALEGLTRPAIRLRRASRPGRAGRRSRLGGQPDLPTRWAWPTYDGVPQSFIGQIDLAEVHPFDVDMLLPPSGLLSFFYDSKQSVWGFDPTRVGGWAVYGFESEVALATAPWPAELQAAARFSGVPLEAATEYTWPDPGSIEVEALGLNRAEQAAYGEAVEDDLGVAEHRLLGHALPVRDEMRLECQPLDDGLYSVDSSGSTGARAPALAPGALDWRLLLQVDSEHAAGMLWGDCERLYYWIRSEDLALRAWHRARAILQCS
jgi:hypothetical protein